MNPKEVILKALKREKKGERGLRIVGPNSNLADGHVAKANHNLIVMTDLSRLGHSDWVAVSAYYSMYHSATAVLAKIGLDSKDHATTVAILEYFFDEKIGIGLLKKFNEIMYKKEKIEQLSIEDKFIGYIWKAKLARETIQYGVETSYKETDLIMKHAREFVTKMKLVLNEIDAEVVEVVKKEVRNLDYLVKI